MSIFNKLQEPVFLRESSNAKRQLEQLKAVDCSGLSKELAAELELNIKSLELGIKGEENIIFELKHSHMPMYVLHDLHLEHAGLLVQIDFLVFTQACTFVIECKNLSGNIEINTKGDFILSNSYGKEQGIYSPLTQNQRKLDLIKYFCTSGRRGIVWETGFRWLFKYFFSSLIVLANDGTIINDKYAKKGIKSKVIRRDALIAHIRKVKKHTSFLFTDYSGKIMKSNAEFLLDSHIEREIDYAAKYRAESIGVSQQPFTISTEAVVNQELSVSYTCPECNAVMTIKTRKRDGVKFWGCPNYYVKCSGSVTHDYVNMD